MRFFPLSKLTLFEVLKDRLFLGMLVIEVLLILVSYYLSELVAGDTVKVAMDFILSFFFFLVALFSAFVSVNSVRKDIEEKQVYLILSKPIDRKDYVLGKFTGIGISIVLFALSSFLVFTTGILIISSLAELYVPHAVLVERIFLLAILLSFMGLLLSSVGIFMGIILSSSILAVVTTILVFLAGLELSPVREIALKSDYVSPINKILVKVAYYTFPNFSLFDVKSFVVHPNVEFSPIYAIALILYSLLYSAGLVAISIHFFRRKDL